MKRMITSLLVVVLLVGLVGLGAFAETYSATRYVLEGYFAMNQAGAVPSYAESGISSPATFNYAISADGCIANTEVNINSGMHTADAYVMVCGEHIIEHGGIRVFETYDDYCDEDDAGLYLASARCVQSTTAVKTYHCASYSSEDSLDYYELEIVSDTYEQFYAEQ